MKNSLDIESIQKQLVQVARQIDRYKAIAFFVVIAALYGFIIWRINALSNVQPSQQQVSELENAATQPKIPQTTVDKIRSLQDNSVRVQTLFNDARNNPFQ